MPKRVSTRKKMSAPPAAEEPPARIDSPEHQDESRKAIIRDIQDSIQDIVQDGDVPGSDTALPPPAADSEEADEQGEQDEEEEDEQDEGSCYWDAATMAPLNAVSAAAVARLRAYTPPPFPLWDRLPVSRRAAVLLLLYADRRGHLRVVITMRAASLRSFSGHAALPGGKADTLDETPYQIARREAWEEIGLPLDDTKLPPPFRIEHLCYLPMSLARTELVVRPCVALLHTGDSSSSTTTRSPSPTVEDSLIPRLDAKEVAAVFSAPFHNFLRTTDEVHPEPAGSTLSPSQQQPRPLPAGNWYEGTWTTWHDSQWRMHFFYVPVTHQRVVKPPTTATTNTKKELSSSEQNGVAEGEEGEGDELARTERFKVWGMTARILVDAATVAYDEKPEFEHNRHFGDERIIEGLAAIGRMGEKKKAGSVFTPEDLRMASEAVRRVEGGKGGGEGSKM